MCKFKLGDRVTNGRRSGVVSDFRRRYITDTDLEPVIKWDGWLETMSFEPLTVCEPPAPDEMVEVWRTDASGHTWYTGTAGMAHTMTDLHPDCYLVRAGEIPQSLQEQKPDKPAWCNAIAETIELGEQVGLF